MNYTEHYNLNQWEAADRVLRTDFNADNAKIDAAIKAVDAKADSKADVSALAQKSEVIVGTYVGNGTAQREINLGGKPKAVYLCAQSGLTASGIYFEGGLSLQGAPAMMGSVPVFELTDTGFTVYYFMLSNTSGIASNLEDMTFYYIAFM